MPPDAAITPLITPHAAIFYFRHADAMPDAMIDAACR